MGISEMLDKYADWIRSEISVTNIGEYCQITTPFLDHMNDYIQMYAKFDRSGQIELSDDGYIINNLAMSGVKLTRSPARKERLAKTLHAYGASMVGDEIVSTATIEDFPRKKHLFVQALMRVDDMFTTTQNSIKDMFNDDVKSFFDSHNIFYSENLSVIGKTGSVHPYEFHFQRTRSKPERFCKTINRLTRTTRDSAIFGWVDTEEAREHDSELLVIINDENPIRDADMNAFKSYKIEPICFNSVESNISRFCA